MDAGKRTLYLVLQLCLSLQGSLQKEEQCEFANVHFVNEDGKEQIFTVGVRTEDEVHNFATCGGPPSQAELDLQRELASCSACSSCSGRGEFQAIADSNNAAALVTSSPNKLLSMPTSRYMVTELAPTVSVMAGVLPSVCEKGRVDLPQEFCCGVFGKTPGDTCTGAAAASDTRLSEDQLQHYASLLAEEGLVPMATRDMETDKELAYGLLLLASGQVERSISHFSGMIKKDPDLIQAYHGRGMAHARKGVQGKHAKQAAADFTAAIDLDRSVSESYERRAEIYLPMSRYNDALVDVNMAIKLQPSSRLYFIRGTVQFALGDLVAAEKDFRRSLRESEGKEKEESDQRLQALYNLGLTLYHRGKNRNSIEVFKDVIKLKKNHIEAHLCLGQAYRELGDFKRAKSMFDAVLSLQPDNSQALQLRGSLFYYSGNSKTALQDFNKCLLLDPYNKVCQYMQGLSHTALGQYYNGVKALTKVLVYNNTPTIKLTPEFIKAHYLKEHARYLHQHLDRPLDSLNPDSDLDGEFRDHWAKLLPFQFENNYVEQPGLQPNTEDVHNHEFRDQPPALQELLCKSQKLGTLTQVAADGYLPNKRLNLAMGLAALDIAQLMEDHWKDVRNSKNNHKMTWKELFNKAVQYRRLVDPETPILWLDQMPDAYLNQGYNAEMHFIRGHTLNLMLAPYSDLVLKLVQSMVAQYKGVGAVNSARFKNDLQSVDSYEDLIGLAKDGKLEQHGLMLSTQLPSLRTKDQVRHDGIILTLTGDPNGKVVFAMSLATTKARTASYNSELDFVFTQLYQEIRKNGVQKIANMDLLLNLVLSLVYYFYNLMPLSHGSSAVAYAVAMGLVMSLGREVTGKIPHAKLVEIEAMMSGAPDAFTLVLKQWMNIKKSNTPVSSLPRVSQVFPTVRHVIEGLNMATVTC